MFGVLGLAMAEADRSGTGTASGAGRTLRWASLVAAAGVPFTFALGMPASLVPPAFGVLTRLGGALVGAGLLVVAATLVPRVGGLWRLALGLLGLKTVGQLAVAAGPAASWAVVPALRVFYLHLMLLGFVTLGLVAAARTTWGEGATRGRHALAAAVGFSSSRSSRSRRSGRRRGVGVPWAVAACAVGPVLVAAWVTARATPLRSP